MTVLELDGILLQDGAGIREAVRCISKADPLPVVVVSAMGRTADQIQRAVEKACRQDVVWASTLAEGMRTYHMQVTEMVASGTVLRETKSLLSDLFEEFAQFLQGLYLLGELTDHGRRMAAFYGERASAIIQVGALMEEGMAACSVGSRESMLSWLGTDAQQHGKQFKGELEKFLQQGTIPLIAKSFRDSVAIS